MKHGHVPRSMAGLAWGTRRKMRSLLHWKVRPRLLGDPSHLGNKVGQDHVFLIAIFGISGLSGFIDFHSVHGFYINWIAVWSQSCLPLWVFSCSTQLDLWKIPSIVRLPGVHVAGFLQRLVYGDFGHLYPQLQLKGRFLAAKMLESWQRRNERSKG